MEYCLIEKWHKGYQLPLGSQAIALTPEASYGLEKSGIKYLTFYDYFSSAEIRGDTDSYLLSQISWIREFDKFIQSVYPEAKELGLCLPSLFFCRIKYLMDNIILNSRIINKFINIANPSKIWFIPQIYGEDKFERLSWFDFAESSLFRLAKPVCAERKVPFEVLMYEDEKDSQKENIKIKPSVVLAKLRNAIFSKSIEFLKKVNKEIKRRQCLNYSRDKGECKKVFVVRESYYTSEFYKDWLINGWTIYFKENEKIKKLKWCKQTMCTKIAYAEALDDTDKENMSSIMKSFLKTRLMDWINVECQIDVSQILFTRLEFIIGEMFRETICRIKQYVEFYKQEHIDFVVSYFLSTLDDHAAIAAGRINKGTKCIGFSHGMDAFELKSRFHDYNLFDYFFVNLKEELSLSEKLKETLGQAEVKISYSTYLKDRYSAIKKTKRKKRLLQYKADKPLVVFLPVERVQRINMPIENSQPLQWDYFIWHNKIFDYFISRTDFHFIWKALPQRYGRVDTASMMLDDKKPGNVDFSTGSVSEWFKYADRVICDMPSTAFFESIFCGLPVLGLYRLRDQKLREDAYTTYGRSLQPYADNEKGIKVINSFLNGNSEDYIVQIAQEKISIIDFIDSYKEM